MNDLKVDSNNDNTTEAYVSQKEFRKLNRYVIGIMLVSAAGFLTLLWATAQVVIDSVNNKTDTYKALVEGNKAQDEKINSLNTTIEVMKAQQPTVVPVQIP